MCPHPKFVLNELGSEGCGSDGLIIIINSCFVQVCVVSSLSVLEEGKCIRVSTVLHLGQGQLFIQAVRLMQATYLAKQLQRAQQH